MSDGRPSYLDGGIIVAGAEQPFDGDPWSEQYFHVRSTPLVVASIDPPVG